MRLEAWQILTGHENAEVFFTNAGWNIPRPMTFLPGFRPPTTCDKVILPASCLSLKVQIEPKTEYKTKASNLFESPHNGYTIADVPIGVLSYT